MCVVKVIKLSGSLKFGRLDVTSLHKS